MSKEKGPMENNTKNDKPQNSERKIPDDFVLVKGDEKFGLNDFYICKHTVTDKEFIDVMGLKPFNAWGDYHVRNNFPVTHVNILDAIYYCNKRSLMEGFEPVYMFGKYNQTNPEKWSYKPCLGKSTSSTFSKNEAANGYRLPFDVEWDYAAKAGENFKYSGSDNLDEVAWNGCNKKSRGVHEVMQKKPNAFGLYDMTGNVDEWCEWRAKNPDPEWVSYKNEPPVYPCRGGCWEHIKDIDYLDPDYSSYSYRYSISESTYELDNQLDALRYSASNEYLGFRLVLSGDKKNAKPVETEKIEKLFYELHKKNNQPDDDFILIKPDSKKKVYQSLKPFYVCEHRVSQREFYNVMGFTTQVYFPIHREGQCKPYSAIQYCNKLSLLEGLEPYYTLSDKSPLFSENWKQNENANGYRLLSDIESSYIREMGEKTKKRQQKIAASAKPKPEILNQFDSFCLTIVNEVTSELALDVNGGSYFCRGNLLTLCGCDARFRIARSFFE